MPAIIPIFSRPDFISAASFLPFRQLMRPPVAKSPAPVTAFSLRKSRREDLRIFLSFIIFEKVLM
jgi:hypothetical protein